MKAISKRTFVVLLALITLIAATIGLTVSYFSDVDTAEGSATVYLKGETTIDEGDKDFKEIVITNTGNADVIVRVKLFGVDDEKMDVSVPDGWAAGDDGWYYYKKILAGGNNETTGAPITVKMKADLTDAQIAELGDSFEVTVVHEATPVAYDDNGLILPDGWKLPAGVPEQ